jgi:hypothetical protein
MSQDNCVHVVLINPAGVLIDRTVNFNPAQGSAGVEHGVKSGLQIVALYVERDVQGDAGGPFWDEYSGNSQYSCAESYDGVLIVKRDLTGATKGAIKKSYFDNADSPGPNTPIANAFEESAVAQGANWPVLDGGEGSSYEQKLAEARILVGFPS